MFTPKPLGSSHGEAAVCLEESGHRENTDETRLAVSWQLLKLGIMQDSLHYFLQICILTIVHNQNLKVIK